MQARKERPPYRVPEARFVSRVNAPKLYRLEDQRNAFVMMTAEELKRLHKFTDLHREALPEALLNTLESFDTEAGLLAARAFIERHGG